MQVAWRHLFACNWSFTTVLTALVLWDLHRGRTADSVATVLERDVGNISVWSIVTSALVQHEVLWDLHWRCAAVSVATVLEEGVGSISVCAVVASALVQHKEHWGFFLGSVGRDVGLLLWFLGLLGPVPFWGTLEGAVGLLGVLGPGLPLGWRACTFGRGPTDLRVAGFPTGWGFPCTVGRLFPPPPLARLARLLAVAEEVVNPDTGFGEAALEGDAAEVAEEPEETTEGGGGEEAEGGWRTNAERPLRLGSMSLTLVKGKPRKLHLWLGVWHGRGVTRVQPVFLGEGTEYEGVCGVAWPVGARLDMCETDANKPGTSKAILTAAGLVDETH